MTFNNQSIAVNDINLESSDANNVVYEIENIELTKDSKLDVELAPGGGFALSIIEKR